MGVDDVVPLFSTANLRMEGHGGVNRKNVGYKHMLGVLFFRPPR